MMEGAPVEDISDRFLDAISRLEEVADAVTPHDASRQLDETSMQVLWRTWAGIRSGAGALWRVVNEGRRDPPSHHMTRTLTRLAAAVRWTDRYEEEGQR